jgi:DNA-binding XRE family transcriptional regulator
LWNNWTPASRLKGGCRLDSPPYKDDPDWITNMARKFQELVDKMSPESRARTKELLENMALDELRAARELTQVTLAKLLNVSQSEVSKIENRADMYVSTLASYVKAMGGQLEICAVFPDGKVKITQFEELATR